MDCGWLINAFLLEQISQDLPHIVGRLHHSIVVCKDLPVRDPQHKNLQGFQRMICKGCAWADTLQDMV